LNVSAHDDDAFRGELRSWLTAHPPPAIPTAETPAHADALRDWQRALHSGGWVGIHWPVEHGGRGASAAQIAIYNEELARVDAPAIPGRVGVTLVGPTLIAHGTDAQRRQWMARILTADDVWCQLFSEPGAGSDLASLSTRAERHGDVYVVSGQKVWSSYATFADWGITLVRTDRAEPRSKGLSMLAIPMAAPGVDVRPLRQMTGENAFSEVFIDEVKVPVANLIGAEHDGWRVASTTLGNERGGSFIWREQVRHDSAVDLLWTTCAQAGVLQDPRVRQHLARSWIDAELFRLHNARALARLARGEEIGAEASIVKLFWAAASQRLYETACNVLGPQTLLADSEWAHNLLASRANSIMGGTSEIQRTIIGERILGLPRPDA
jgi:alkylation response protein AidB-like acyl-CoA dehydrogenase